MSHCKRKLELKLFETFVEHITNLCRKKNLRRSGEEINDLKVPQFSVER